MIGVCPIVIAALLCAGLTAPESKAPAHADLLVELEQLGAMLDAAREPQGLQAWRRRASAVSIRADSERLFERSELRLSDLYPTREMCAQLRLWADAEGEQLPSAARYQAWLRELKRALSDFQRLGTEPPSAPSRMQAQGELDSILQQPAYTEVARARPGLAARIAELVARYVFYPLFGPKRSATIQKAVTFVCLVILALLLAHTVWELWTALRSGRRLGAAQGRRALAQAVPLESAEELITRGDRLWTAGLLQQALGFYYLALISYLARARCTRLDRSLTNWEHYQLAARSGRLRDPDLRRLAELNGFFDEHCYGGLQPSEGSVRQFRAWVLEFRDAT